MIFTVKLTLTQQHILMLADGDNVQAGYIAVDNCWTSNMHPCCGHYKYSR